MHDSQTNTGLGGNYIPPYAREQAELGRQPDERDEPIVTGRGLNPFRPGRGHGPGSSDRS